MKLACSLLDKGFRLSSTLRCFSDYDAGSEIDVRKCYDAMYWYILYDFWWKNPGALSQSQCQYDQCPLLMQEIIAMLTIISR